MNIQNTREEPENNIVATGIMVIICAGICLMWVLWYLATHPTV